jgi:hypothetical protein
MRRDEMARSAARDVRDVRDELAAIEERIALAERLLREERRDDAALALDGLLWRMAWRMARLVSDGNDAPEHSHLPGIAEPIMLDAAQARLLILLRLAAQAPNVEARLAQYAALARGLREAQGMRRGSRAQGCPVRRASARHRRQGKGKRYDGYR